jgi:hypothetical protein
MAQGTPTAPAITSDACALTLEFDVDVDGQYTLELWDNGVLVHSETQGGSVGDHLTFSYVFSSGIAPGGAPGIGILLYRGPSLVYIADPFIGGLTGDCQASIAGRCDPMFPDTSVVGQVTQNTNVYFAPSSDSASDVVLEVGSTWWVAGVDESGGFYNVYIGCASVWVPTSAMGPNYDDVWNGQPLPTDVVE